MNLVNQESILTNLTNNKLGERLDFETVHSKEEAKSLLQTYFKTTQNSINKDVRFSGLFISEHEFEIRSKWEMTFSSKPYRSMPYILGQILSNHDGKTQIQLRIRKEIILKWYLLLPFILPVSLIFYGFSMVGIATLLFFVIFIIAALLMVNNNMILELKTILKLTPVE